MNRHAKRIIVLISGWFFIVLGIAGLFLPILQGVLFIFIGLVILSSEYEWAQHLLAKVRTRFPKISGAADEASARVGRWLRRIRGETEAN